MLKKMLKNSLLIALFLPISCSNSKSPEIFQQVKNKYRDLKIDHSNYFLKDFGWSNKTITISGKDYRELKCSKDSYFFIGGYCRFQNEHLLLIPLDYKNNSDYKEDTLFSFSTPNQTAWNIQFDYDKKMSSGDSIVFTGKSFVQNDTLFKFTLYPYYFFPVSNHKRFLDHQFDIEVSKTRGIIKIFTMQGNGDTLYDAVLFPEEKFTNRMGKKLLL